MEGKGRGGEGREEGGIKIYVILEAIEELRPIRIYIIIMYIHELMHTKCSNFLTKKKFFFSSHILLFLAGEV